MSEHYVVRRWRKPPLEFDGTILADVTSQEPGDRRWQEIRIYRTTRDRFVTESVGRSTLPGEHDFLHVNVLHNPRVVANALQQRSDGREYLTDLAVEALEMAAVTVPPIWTGTEAI